MCRLLKEEHSVVNYIIIIYGKIHSEMFINVILDTWSHANILVSHGQGPISDMLSIRKMLIPIGYTAPQMEISV